MPVVVLVRHGRSTANSAGILAGRTEGVELDEHGHAQALALADRLEALRPDQLISSPLLRCRQTIAPLAERLGLPVELDDRFLEVDYGSWSGRKLSELSQEPLWKVVQGQPSLAVFPDGEGLAQVSHRVVSAVQDRVRGAADRDVLLICSHGDVIASLLADSLGLHLDGYQRLHVAPASVSVLRFTPARTFVERFGDSGPLGDLRPPSAKLEAGATDGTAGGAQVSPSDAVVGGAAS